MYVCVCVVAQVCVGMLWRILISFSSVLLQDVSVFCSSLIYMQTQSTANTISLPLFTYSANTAHITSIENLIHYAEDVQGRAYHD